jgi:hypothetical protein
VDFLVKNAMFCHGLETQTGIGAMSTPDGSLVEPRLEKHGDKYHGGVFGKARHTFCCVFRLRN